MNEQLSHTSLQQENASHLPEAQRFAHSSTDGNAAFKHGVNKQSGEVVTKAELERDDKHIHIKFRDGSFVQKI